MPGKSPPGRAEPTLTENAASPFQVNQHTSSSLFSSSISMFVSRVQSRGSKVVALKLSTAASEARTPFPLALGRAPPEDATRTQNSMFGIRNLRKPRELSQPNQLDMVGERGFEPPTPWSRTRCSTRLSHSPTLCRGRWRNCWAPSQETSELLVDYNTGRSPIAPASLWG